MHEPAGLHLPGRDQEDALRTIKGYLESLEKHGDPIPPSIGEEIIEVITHLAFYSGWPTAISAANVAKQVLEQGDSK